MNEECNHENCDYVWCSECEDEVATHCLDCSLELDTHNWESDTVS